MDSEKVFAKLEHLLRKAAARAIESICTAIGEILGAFTAEECAYPKIITF